MRWRLEHPKQIGWLMSGPGMADESQGRSEKREGISLERSVVQFGHLAMEAGGRSIRISRTYLLDHIK
jgi:hypothetical protein